jgi:hypothetical protein
MVDLLATTVILVLIVISMACCCGFGLRYLLHRREQRYKRYKQHWKNTVGDSRYDDPRSDFDDRDIRAGRRSDRDNSRQSSHDKSHHVVIEFAHHRDSHDEGRARPSKDTHVKRDEHHDTSHDHDKSNSRLSTHTSSSSIVPTFGSDSPKHSSSQSSHSTVIGQPERNSHYVIPQMPSFHPNVPHFPSSFQI